MSTELAIAIVLGFVAVVLSIGVIVFLWWQFSFTDSKLAKLIDNRSKLNCIPELDDSELEELEKEESIEDEYL